MRSSRKIIQDKRVNFDIPNTSEHFEYCCLLYREYGYKVFLDAIIKVEHFIPENIHKPRSCNSLTINMKPLFTKLEQFE